MHDEIRRSCKYLFNERRYAFFLFTATRQAALTHFQYTYSEPESTFTGHRKYRYGGTGFRDLMYFVNKNYSDNYNNSSIRSIVTATSRVRS